MLSLIEVASLLRGTVPALKMYEERAEMEISDQVVGDIRYEVDSARGTFSLSVPRRDYFSRRSSSD